VSFFQTDDEGGEHPIVYMSAKLIKAQLIYSITELECYAAMLSITKFRAYVDGMPFKVITDHASLKWLMGQKVLSGRLARWSLKLQDFDFTIEHRKGSLNVVQDALSRVHMDELQKAGAEELDIHINLHSTAFQPSDYVNLVQAVDVKLGKSPDLQTSVGYVYKQMGFCLNDAVDETRAWKIWVPAELRPDLLWRAHHAIKK